MVTPAPEAVAFSPVVVVIVAVALGPEAVPHHGASSYCYCYFLLLRQHPGMHGGIDRGDLAVGMFLRAMLGGMTPGDLDASMFCWAMLVGMGRSDLEV